MMCLSCLSSWGAAVGRAAELGTDELAESHGGSAACGGNTGGPNSLSGSPLPLPLAGGSPSERLDFLDGFLLGVALRLGDLVHWSEVLSIDGQWYVSQLSSCHAFA